MSAVLFLCVPFFRQIWIWSDRTSVWSTVQPFPSLVEAQESSSVAITLTVVQLKTGDFYCAAHCILLQHKILFGFVGFFCSRQQNTVKPLLREHLKIVNFIEDWEFLCFGDQLSQIIVSVHMHLFAKFRYITCPKFTGLRLLRLGV